MKFAVRQLLKSPGFTAIALLTLTLGIGVNTAMFTVVNTLLFQPAPYPDSAQVVRVYGTNAQGDAWPHSLPDLRDLGTQGQTFASVTPYQWWIFSLAEPGQPAEALNGVVAAANLFDTLGLQPVLGRAFTAEEQQAGRDTVAVLSDACWRRKFGADPGIIGRSLRIGGESVTIIGVMPAQAEYPTFWGPIDVWRPLPLAEGWREDRSVSWLQAVARLKPGVSRTEAQAESTVIAGRLALQYPGSNAGKGVRLVPLVGSEVAVVHRRLIWLTLGLAGFVLLIACANLGNLQLARSAGRARDFAIRAALGASRPALMRRLLVENLLLGLAGGGLGLLAAQFLTSFLAPHLFAGKTANAVFQTDGRVFAFALGVAVLAGLLSGGIPAWLASRTDVNLALKQQSRGATGDRGRQRGRQALIVSQIAFSVVLLAGSAFFLRGLQRYLTQDPGWRVEGLVRGTMTLTELKYPTEASRRLFHQRLMERVARLPGVEGAALTVSLPLRDYTTPMGFVPEGREEPRPGHEPFAFHNIVSADYFSLLGIRLVEGRAFAPAEPPAGSPHQIIISESIARQFWPGESAIGRRIREVDPQGRPHWEVIGVVRDVGLAGNVDTPATHYQIYHNMAQNPWGYFTLVARSRNPATLADPLRRAVAELDPDLPVVELRTVQETVAGALHDLQVTNKLLAAFAGLGLCLAALGIYGVISGLVAMRIQEFGIRLALGAQPEHVLRIVLGNGVRLAGLGTALGLGLAALLLPSLSAAFPGLPGLDVPAFLAVVALLLAVTLVACWLPARRATKVDPMVALRAE
ncbi:ABC transporter permease [Lacunisphaera limnophila]|uniref:ABC transporter permease n=1 Tax=Lacunisphaera limnophila TaxID=1838286 RepID=UPI0012FD5B49|nr:ABC transporter permease [Lacunisphaera limnophila]